MWNYFCVEVKCDLFHRILTFSPFSLKFTVVATDGGGQRDTATCTVEVVRNQAPIITNAPVVIPLNNNHTVNSEVFTVLARDDDNDVRLFLLYQY